MRDETRGDELSIRKKLLQTRRECETRDETSEEMRDESRETRARPERRDERGETPTVRLFQFVQSPRRHV
jgi:hypothetical protein